ncbi:hypothetical protein DIPPA_13479 [Diplonema papillatum]|nr:hypothetical protein DIPPA_13479 [Diplonema papillatum]
MVGPSDASGHLWREIDTENGQERIVDVSEFEQDEQHSERIVDVREFEQDEQHSESVDVREFEQDEQYSEDAQQRRHEGAGSPVELQPLHIPPRGLEQAECEEDDNTPPYFDESTPQYRQLESSKSEDDVDPGPRRHSFPFRHDESTRELQEDEDVSPCIRYPLSLEDDESTPQRRQVENSNSEDDEDPGQRRHSLPFQHDESTRELQEDDDVTPCIRYPLPLEGEANPQRRQLNGKGNPGKEEDLGPHRHRPCPPQHDEPTPRHRQGKKGSKLAESDDPAVRRAGLPPGPGSASKLSRKAFSFAPRRPSEKTMRRLASASRAGAAPAKPRQPCPVVARAAASFSAQRGGGLGRHLGGLAGASCSFSVRGTGNGGDTGPAGPPPLADCETASSDGDEADRHPPVTVFDEGQPLSAFRSAGVTASAGPQAAVTGTTPSRRQPHEPAIFRRGSGRTGSVGSGGVEGDHHPPVTVFDEGQPLSAAFPSAGVASGGPQAAVTPSLRQPHELAVLRRGRGRTGSVGSGGDEGDSYPPVTVFDEGQPLSALPSAGVAGGLQAAATAATPSREPAGGGTEGLPLAPYFSGGNSPKGASAHPGKGGDRLITHRSARLSMRKAVSARRVPPAHVAHGGVDQRGQDPGLLSADAREQDGKEGPDGREKCPEIPKIARSLTSRRLGGQRPRAESITHRTPPASLRRAVSARRIASSHRAQVPVGANGGDAAPQPAISVGGSGENVLHDGGDPFASFEGKGPPNRVGGASAPSVNVSSNARGSGRGSNEKSTSPKREGSLRRLADVLPPAGLTARDHARAGRAASPKRKGLSQRLGNALPPTISVSSSSCADDPFTGDASRGVSDSVGLNSDPMHQLDAGPSRPPGPALPQPSPDGADGGCDAPRSGALPAACVPPVCSNPAAEPALEAAIGGRVTLPPASPRADGRRGLAHKPGSVLKRGRSPDAGRSTDPRIIEPHAFVDDSEANSSSPRAGGQQYLARKTVSKLKRGRSPDSARATGPRIIETHALVEDSEMNSSHPLPPSSPQASGQQYLAHKTVSILKRGRSPDSARTTGPRIIEPHAFLEDSEANPSSPRANGQQYLVHKTVSNLKRGRSPDSARTTGPRIIETHALVEDSEIHSSPPLPPSSPRASGQQYLAHKTVSIVKRGRSPDSARTTGPRIIEPHAFLEDSEVNPSSPRANSQQYLAHEAANGARLAQSPDAAGVVIRSAPDAQADDNAEDPGSHSPRRAQPGSPRGPRRLADKTISILRRKPRGTADPQDAPSPRHLSPAHGATGGTVRLNDPPSPAESSSSDGSPREEGAALLSKRALAFKKGVTFRLTTRTDNALDADAQPHAPPSGEPPDSPDRFLPSKSSAWSLMDDVDLPVPPNQHTRSPSPRGRSAARSFRSFKKRPVQSKLKAAGFLSIRAKPAVKTLAHKLLSFKAHHPCDPPSCPFESSHIRRLNLSQAFAPFADAAGTEPTATCHPQDPAPQAASPHVRSPVVNTPSVAPGPAAAEQQNAGPSEHHSGGGNPDSGATCQPKESTPLVAPGPAAAEQQPTGMSAHPGGGATCQPKESTSLGAPGPAAAEQQGADASAQPWGAAEPATASDLAALDHLFSLAPKLQACTRRCVHSIRHPSRCHLAWAPLLTLPRPAPLARVSSATSADTEGSDTGAQPAANRRPPTGGGQGDPPTERQWRRAGELHERAVALRGAWCEEKRAEIFGSSEFQQVAGRWWRKMHADSLHPRVYSKKLSESAYAFVETRLYDELLGKHNDTLSMISAIRADYLVDCTSTLPLLPSPSPPATTTAAAPDPGRRTGDAADRVEEALPVGEASFGLKIDSFEGGDRPVAPPPALVCGKDGRDARLSAGEASFGVKIDSFEGGDRPVAPPPALVCGKDGRDVGLGAGEASFRVKIDSFSVNDAGGGETRLRREGTATPAVCVENTLRAGEASFGRKIDSFSTNEVAAFGVAPRTAEAEKTADPTVPRSSQDPTADPESAPELQSSCGETGFGVEVDGSRGNGAAALRIEARTAPPGAGGDAAVSGLQTSFEAGFGAEVNDSNANEAAALRIEARTAKTDADANTAALGPASSQTSFEAGFGAAINDSNANEAAALRIEARTAKTDADADTAALGPASLQTFEAGCGGAKPDPSGTLWNGEQAPDHAASPRSEMAAGNRSRITVGFVASAKASFVIETAWGGTTHRGGEPPADASPQALPHKGKAESPGQGPGSKGEGYGATPASAECDEAADSAPRERTPTGAARNEWWGGGSRFAVLVPAENERGSSNAAAASTRPTALPDPGRAGRGTTEQGRGLRGSRHAGVQHAPATAGDDGTAEDERSGSGGPAPAGGERAERHPGIVAAEVHRPTDDPNGGTGNEAQTVALSTPGGQPASPEHVDDDSCTDDPPASPRAHADSQPGVGYAAYCWSLFELADTWTSTVSPEEYVALLADLLRRVFHTDGQDATFDDNTRALQRAVVLKEGAQRQKVSDWTETRRTKEKTRDESKGEAVALRRRSFPMKKAAPDREPGREKPGPAVPAARQTIRFGAPGAESRSQEARQGLIRAAFAAPLLQTEGQPAVPDGSATPQQAGEPPLSYPSPTRRIVTVPQGEDNPPCETSPMGEDAEQAALLYGKRGDAVVSGVGGCQDDGRLFPAGGRARDNRESWAESPDSELPARIHPRRCQTAVATAARSHHPKRPGSFQPIPPRPSLGPPPSLEPTIEPFPLTPRTPSHFEHSAIAMADCMAPRDHHFDEVMPQERGSGGDAPPAEPAGGTAAARGGGGGGKGGRGPRKADERLCGAWHPPKKTIVAGATRPYHAGAKPSRRLGGIGWYPYRRGRQRWWLHTACVLPMAADSVD